MTRPEAFCGNCFCPVKMADDGFWDHDCCCGKHKDVVAFVVERPRVMEKA